MRHKLRSSENRLKALILILIALQVAQLGYAQDPPDPDDPPDRADLGAPPPPPGGVAPGPGPGFSQDKKDKKDDNDDIPLGTSVAVLAYLTSGAAFLAIDFVAGRPILRRAGDGVRTLLRRPETREVMGPMGEALEKLDTAEPKLFGEIEDAQRQYREAHDKLEPHLKGAVVEAMDEHLRRMLGLGLMTNPLKSEVEPLIQAYLSAPRDPNAPLDPQAIDAWLAKKEVREHRLFKTAPGQQWLAEWARLKETYALSRSNQSHTLEQLKAWMARQPQTEKWAVAHRQLQEAEERAAVAYTLKLQEIVGKAAQYTNNPALKQRLLKDSRERLVEPVADTYSTEYDPGRTPRQAGDFAEVGPDGRRARADAAGLANAAKKQCGAYTALARNMERLRVNITRLPIAKITLGVGTAGAAAATGGITLQGLRTFLSPIARATKIVRPENTDTP